MKTTSDEIPARAAETGPALEIRANGETRSVPPGTSVAGFLARHDLDPDLVVVERNGRILRRQDFDGTTLEPGDELEIVHFVGGG
ncbi:MAG TPA: sulfur carrier protein ThiS [Gemmatimonadota bacterium]|jgi:thiamine biosynthesis protein ThiS|nr:sulfur carrier protein ThiS [Gemmatimonadota bacterium]